VTPVVTAGSGDGVVAAAELAAVGLAVVDAVVGLEAFGLEPKNIEYPLQSTPNASTLPAILIKLDRLVGM
jgi:hypothetical protein